MMKRIITMFLCIVLLTSAVGCSREGDLDMKYNNSISIASAINKTYSETDIEDLQNDLDTGTITYNELKSKFKIQCTRKTFQGYYIILNLEMNSRAFLFLNSSLELSKILKVNKFHKKSDFSFVEPTLTTAEAINTFDESVVYYPISSVYATGHILSDGYMLILYDRVIDGILLDDPVVKSIEFTSNEDMEKKTDDFWIQNTPFILPIDKTF